MAEIEFAVHVERDECILCGTCWDVCPEVFEPSDEDGLCQIVEDYRTPAGIAHGKVSGAQLDCVTEAAEGCPVEIITVEEIPLG